MIFNYSFLDYAIRTQFSFQDAATYIMQGIVNLHHHILFFLIMVLIFVFWVFFKTFKVSFWSFNISPFIWLLDKKSNKPLNYWGELNYNKQFLKKLKNYSGLNISHGTFLEIVWTVVPSLILLFIVGPSFTLLYAMDTASSPDFSVKVIGHQWYWSYEYSDSFIKDESNYNVENLGIFFNSNCININSTVETAEYIFDSYMKATSELDDGELRLLEVDNALYLPIFSKVRLDITSEDVLHSFAVPSLGIKVDAVPGRLNVAYIDILREGVFFGQCSELCGVNHGYMPIKIVALDVSEFVKIVFFCACENFNPFYSTVDFFNIFHRNIYLETFKAKIV